MIEQLHALAKAVFSFFDGLKPTRYYGCLHEDGTRCAGYHKEEIITLYLSRGFKEGYTKIGCEKGHFVNALFLITGNTSFADSLSTASSMKEDFKRELREELDKAPAWAIPITRYLSSVITRVDALSDSLSEYTIDVKQGIKEIPASVSQQFQLAFRDYLNLFNDMLDARDFTPVPSIIAIVPVDGGSVFTRDITVLARDIFQERLTLTLYCEHEKCDRNPVYKLQFRLTREWWEKTAPVAGVLFDVLRAGLIAASAGTLLFAPALWATMKDAATAMKEFANLANEWKKVALESAGKSSHAPDGPGRNNLEPVRLEHSRGDDAFRQARLQLAELLKEIAPSEYAARQWGEKDADDRLERLRMKDNTYRWLCKRHADEYRKMF
ncbi:MAG: hypothetical protein HQK89_15240 [Nitrospirae bacterium]|nr:hypothetical protein [Nitrospirota bacterium]